MNWCLLRSQVNATGTVGPQKKNERLELSMGYIPTHKAYFQVGGTLWLSLAVRLNQNREVSSSILDIADVEEGSFWPLLAPCARVGAWAGFMDSEHIREALI